jgi:hypothetical protein
MPLKSESEPFAGSGLAAAHPELHHYTTFAGLKGIAESNTLWATHFLDLNDSREVFLLEEPLTEVLSKLFIETLRTRQRDSLRLRQIISKRGGLRKERLPDSKGLR